MDTTEIFIAGQARSSKNSKRITPPRNKYRRDGKKARPSVRWSAAATLYRDHAQAQMKSQELRAKWFEMTKGLEVPMQVGMHFVNKTHLVFDFSNFAQTVADLMVMTGWIADDNVRLFLPYPYQRDGAFYTVDKENPGTFLTIIK